MNSLPPSFAREVPRLLHWAASHLTADSPSVLISVHQWFKKSLRRPLPRGIQHFYSTGVASRPSTDSPVPAFSSSAPSLSTLVPRPSTAFTLIELLVVISIIAILAALSFPAVNGAINAARKAQARNDVMQIAAAIKAYQSEYGRMPHDGISDDVWIDENRAIMAVLLNEPPNAPLNPKGIKFLDPKTSTKPKGGFFQGVYYDPWGEQYVLELDTNYNGKIDNPYFGKQNLSTVSVISYAGDGQGPSLEKDITSF